MGRVGGKEASPLSLANKQQDCSPCFHGERELRISLPGLNIKIRAAVSRPKGAFSKPTHACFLQPCLELLLQLGIHLGPTFWDTFEIRSAK
jgi:hypothetical protein